MSPQVEIEDVIVREIGRHTDERGWLSELFRSDELPAEFLPVMSYVSMTHPGVARGPHEHRDQSDLFCFIGPSTFRIYLWDNRESSRTFGKSARFEAGARAPLMVIVPKGVVHAYKNVGNSEGIVINCPNRLYGGERRGDPVDEIRYEDDPQNRFPLD